MVELIPNLNHFYVDNSQNNELLDFLRIKPLPTL